MNRAHPVVAVCFAVAVAVGAAEPASAETPAVCVDYSPLGFCLEWGTPGTEDPGTPGGSCQGV